MMFLFGRQFHDIILLITVDYNHQTIIILHHAIAISFCIITYLLFNFWFPISRPLVAPRWAAALPLPSYFESRCCTNNVVALTLCPLHCVVAALQLLPFARVTRPSYIIIHLVRALKPSKRWACLCLRRDHWRPPDAPF